MLDTRSPSPPSAARSVFWKLSSAPRICSAARNSWAGTTRGLSAARGATDRQGVNDLESQVGKPKQILPTLRDEGEHWKASHFHRIRKLMPVFLGETRAARFGDQVSCLLGFEVPKVICLAGVHLPCNLAKGCAELLLLRATISLALLPRFYSLEMRDPG